MDDNPESCAGMAALKSGLQKAQTEGMEPLSCRSSSRRYPTGGSGMRVSTVMSGNRLKSRRHSRERQFPLPAAHDRETNHPGRNQRQDNFENIAHGKTSITLDVYGHLLRNSQDRAIENLEFFFSDRGSVRFCDLVGTKKKAGRSCGREKYCVF